MTTALSAEQIRAFIRELDAEYRRDRTAAETLLRAIEKGGTGSIAPAPASPSRAPNAVLSIKETILLIMRENPVSVWTSQTLTKRLQAMRYDFGRIKNPAHRVQNVISDLHKAGLVKLVRAGAGGIPNEYSIEGKPESSDLPLINNNRILQ